MTQLTDDLLENKHRLRSYLIKYFDVREQHDREVEKNVVNEDKLNSLAYELDLLKDKLLGLEYLPADVDTMLKNSDPAYDKYWAKRGKVLLMFLLEG